MATLKQTVGQPEARDDSICGHSGRRPLWSRIILPEWLRDLLVAGVVGVLDMLGGPDEKENRKTATARNLELRTGHDGKPSGVMAVKTDSNQP